MKVVNENLELVDYEEVKKEEEHEEKYEEEYNPYKTLIKMQLLDLVYEMNNNLHHKMNFFIIGIQLIVCTANVLIGSIFDISMIPMSLAAAICVMLMLFLVFIGNILSEKAIKYARTQEKIICECIERLSERSDKVDEYKK